MYAIRYVLDKDIRKLNLLDSDFHNKQTGEDIEISIMIDISDITSIDCQKLRAGLKGALLSSDTHVHITLKASYDNSELIAIPQLFWGSDKENLQEMKSKGYLYEIDYTVNVLYIDSYVDLNALFKKNIKKISKSMEDLNNHISSLSGVVAFQEKITPEYKKFRQEDISIVVKSEVAVKGLYSNLAPYIKREKDDMLYPSSGDGRKKLLVYSIFDLIAEENRARKINIILIEEPENPLHKSMQIALSQIIFHDEKYQYLFATTHSPYILYEMDNVNLIRVYNQTKMDSASAFYQVPLEFETNRKMLYTGLSEAIFADRVLLVEGSSEVLLFQKVLSVVDPFFEAKGGYILDVKGIGFKKYYQILDELKILNVIKTDNDLRSVPKKVNIYSVLGFSRCNGYIPDKKHHLPTKQISNNTVDSKRDLYNNNMKKLDVIRNKYRIYLSKCDLENDLDEFLHSELETHLGTPDVVDYLQDSKHFNMVKLISKLTDKNCKKIFEHYNFACLKDVVK